MYFYWAVYLFSNGLFSWTIQSQNLPFHINLACETSNAGHSLFSEFAPAAKIFSSGNDLLHPSEHRARPLSVYLINSYRILASNVTTAFWKLQLTVITQLCLIRLLSLIVAIIISHHDGQSLKAFTRGLQAAQWKVSSWDVSYFEIVSSRLMHCHHHYPLMFGIGCYTSCPQDTTGCFPKTNCIVSLGAIQQAGAFSLPWTRRQRLQ